MGYYVIRRRAPNNSDELLHYGTKGMHWGQRDEYVPGQGWVGNGISNRHGLRVTRVSGSSEGRSETTKPEDRALATSGSMRYPKNIKAGLRPGIPNSQVSRSPGMSPSASRIRAMGEKIELGDGKSIRIDKIDANTLPSVEDLYKVWQFLSDDQKSMIQSKLEQIKKKQAKKKQLHRMHIQGPQGPGETHNSKFT